MRTIMYARGPGLKKGFVSKPLMMTDHYNLVCHLMDVEAQPNNGSWIRVQGMLREETDLPSNSYRQSSSKRNHSSSTSPTSLLLMLSSNLFLAYYLSFHPISLSSLRQLLNSRWTEHERNASNHFLTWCKYKIIPTDHILENFDSWHPDVHKPWPFYSSSFMYIKNSLKKIALKSIRRLKLWESEYKWIRRPWLRQTVISIKWKIEESLNFDSDVVTKSFGSRDGDVHWEGDLSHMFVFMCDTILMPDNNYLDHRRNQLHHPQDWASEGREGKEWRIRRMEMMNHLCVLSVTQVLCPQFPTHGRETSDPEKWHVKSVF